MTDRTCVVCGASNPPGTAFCRVCDTYIDWAVPDEADRTLINEVIYEFFNIYRAGVAFGRADCQMAFPATGKVYDDCIAYAKSFPNLWFAKRCEIVEWVKKNCL